MLFTNGQIDPWHYESVLTSISNLEPAIWVPGVSCALHAGHVSSWHHHHHTQASHHFWTHPPLPTDSIYIQEARAKQALVVEAWLSTPYDG